MDSARDIETAGEGLAVTHGSRRVALKWHQLRRRRSDPLFGIEVLKRGLALGASMEIDLRVTGDGGFAVLHDETLDRETDGSGVVAALMSEELAEMHYADQTGGPRRRLLLVDDFADLLHDAHPAALLQFDMKDDLQTVGRRGLDKLANLFDGRNPPIRVSGDCSDLTLAIGERLPGLQQGLEPSFRLIDLYKAGRKADVPGQLVRELRGPIRPSMVYLNWKLLLAAWRDGMDLVAICHDEGAKADAWTFDMADPGKGFSDAEWRNFLMLLELGVDQITTDEAIATERAHAERIARG